MKLFSVSKDGGPKSKVLAFWLTEIKPLFSVALMRFTAESRDEFHSHAFDSVSWVLKGKLTEEHLDGRVERHEPSITPVVTAKSTFHRVKADTVTWVLTFRGPWAKTWFERTPEGKLVTLGYGRKIINWTWTSLGWNQS